MAEYIPGIGYQEIIVEPFSIETIAELVIEETATPITINPGDSNKILEVTKTSDWVLNAVGATDLENSVYWLQVGAVEGTHTKEPLGLFNAPLRLEPGLLIGANIPVRYYAAVDAGATAPQTYIAKFLGYIK